MVQFPRDQIVYRLISHKNNRLRLLDVPHRRYLDMAVIYEVANRHPQTSFFSFESITNKAIKEWGVDEGTLFEAASLNTKRLLGYTCVDTFSQMKTLLAEVKEIFCEEEMEELERLIGFTGEQLDQYVSQNEGSSMYILSNSECRNGASCILYPNVLKDLAAELADDLYLIPDCDEMLAVPADNIRTLEDMRRLSEMLGELKLNWEEPEKLLSETLLYYSRESGALDLVGGIKRKRSGRSMRRGVISTRAVIHEKKSKYTITRFS